MMPASDSTWRVGDHAHLPSSTVTVLPLSSLSCSPGAAPAHGAGRRGSCRGRRCARAAVARTSRSWRCRPRPTRCAGRSGPGGRPSTPGGGLGVHAAHDATGETAAQIGRLTFTGSLSPHWRPRARWPAGQRRAGERRHLARHAITLRQCAQVGRELEGEAACRRASARRGCSCRWGHPRPVRAGRRGRSLRPSSRAEHSMPKLSTPRSLPTLIRKGLPSSPGGSSAPTVASGTLMPTRALGAPQTI
jgi:hypothetical protein